MKRWKTEVVRKKETEKESGGRTERAKVERETRRFGWGEKEKNEERLVSSCRRWR